MICANWQTAWLCFHFFSQACRCLTQRNRNHTGFVWTLDSIGTWSLLPFVTVLSLFFFHTFCEASVLPFVTVLSLFLFHTFCEVSVLLTLILWTTSMKTCWRKEDLLTEIRKVPTSDVFFGWLTWTHWLYGVSLHFCISFLLITLMLLAVLRILMRHRHIFLFSDWFGQWKCKASTHALWCIPSQHLFDKLFTLNALCRQWLTCSASVCVLSARIKSNRYRAVLKVILTCWSVFVVWLN